MTAPAANVTDVLRDRQHESTGLRQMTAVSIALHAVLLVILFFAPGTWFAAQQAPRSVMVISLGEGAPGPANGGISTIGARAIQTAQPLEAPKRPEPVRPPAAKGPIPAIEASPRSPSFQGIPT